MMQVADGLGMYGTDFWEEVMRDLSEKAVTV